MHFIGCFSCLYHKVLMNPQSSSVGQTSLSHLYHFRTPFLDQNPLSSVHFIYLSCAFPNNNYYLSLEHLDHHSFFLFPIFLISINQFSFTSQLNLLAIPWDLQVRYFLATSNLLVVVLPAFGCFGFLVKRYPVGLVSCCQLCFPCF